MAEHSKEMVSSTSRGCGNKLSRAQKKSRSIALAEAGIDNVTEGVRFSNAISSDILTGRVERADGLAALAGQARALKGVDLQLRVVAMKAAGCKIPATLAKLLA